MQKTFTDQLGRKIEIQYPPKTIISLVPSQTELLFYLGLSESVVGITKFCIHPAESFNAKTKVGGTKSFRFDIIDQLKPDLIIGNKEENYVEGITELEKKYPVWMSDISTLEDALNMMEGIGQLTKRETEAATLISEIRTSFVGLRLRPTLKVLYLIWKAPWMAAGKNTFINSTLSKMGLENILTESRYPTISESQLHQLQPDVVMLSSEPFPFNQKHNQELQKALPKAKVILVDGELFSWYGNRMLKAPDYFNSLDL
ncbi:MAG: ABC transporter substrate-binding protein [Cyclobacteriaceae bacterium]